MTNTKLGDHRFLLQPVRKDEGNSGLEVSDAARLKGGMQLRALAAEADEP